MHSTHTHTQRQHSTQSELALLENKRVESIAGSIARGLELESDHCSVWQLKTASVSVLLNVNTDGVYSSSSVFNSVENSSAYTSMDNSDANDASDDDIADAIVVDRKQPLSSDGVCGEEISARTGISASLSSSAQSSSLSSASPSPSSPSSAVDTTLAATTPTSRAAPQFSHSYDVNVYSVNEPHGQNDDSKVKKNDEPHVSDDQHRRIGENENKTDQSNNDHADESRYNENKDRNNGNHAHDDKG